MALANVDVHPATRALMWRWDVPTLKYIKWDGSLTVGVLAIGSVIVTALPSASVSTLTNVPANVANVTLLAANANRQAFLLYNDSTSSVYLKLGATASASSFTKRLLSNDHWSTDALGVNYTGRIDAIWDVANGNMRVTELTT